MCLIADAIRDLEASIRESFAGVKLGKGIGLFEAQVIDDYASEEIQASNRARDEKESWQEIPAEHLNKCTSSLSFFDAEGMRFHLPAYMLCDLRGEYLDDLIFLLAQVPITRTGQFEALNPAQRKSVSSYLEFKAATTALEWDIPHINNALDTYWRPTSPLPAHNQSPE